ncbi:exosortase A [Erythrobacter sp. WG]|uniref:exosortase A n=1 Tax=Erythrobacter sp. WG TaxID=2985510 RepID=UPI002270BC23|nr:exosortase A [Erythrobacter sp. WG]MCX9147658.1 exosortase [Erythrobacter sp. WG]
MPPEAAALPAARHAALPAAWRAPLAGLALGVLALVAVTAGAWGAMLHQWWNIDTYNHLLLVPFIIAWLVGLKARELAALSPQPFWPALGAVAAGLALWRAGEALGVNLLAQAGAVGAVQAAVVTVIGLRASLVLAVPLAFAAFLVPFGDEIIPPLQAITADIAIALVHFAGVPARIEGIHIHTPAGLFIVAEACSGVKFLIAMVALGVLVCATRLRRWTTRAAFIAACVIVPILANGVRAFATIYVAQFVGAERATGFDHIVYGWVFFAIVLAILLGAAWRFVEREPESHGWPPETIAGWAWLTRAEALRVSPGRAAGAIVAMAGVAALTMLL